MLRVPTAKRTDLSECKKTAAMATTAEKPGATSASCPNSMAKREARTQSSKSGCLKYMLLHHRRRCILPRVVTLLKTSRKFLRSARLLRTHTCLTTQLRKIRRKRLSKRSASYERPPTQVHRKVQEIQIPCLEFCLVSRICG